MNDQHTQPTLTKRENFGNKEVDILPLVSQRYFLLTLLDVILRVDNVLKSFSNFQAQDPRGRLIVDCEIHKTFQKELPTGSTERIGQ